MYNYHRNQLKYRSEREILEEIEKRLDRIELLLGYNNQQQQQQQKGAQF